MPPWARTPAASAPANHATLNNIALDVIVYHGFRYLPDANFHFMMHRGAALNGVLSSD